MLNEKWISATSTRHYFHEPLLDWFKYASKPFKSKTNITTIIKPNNLRNYMMEQGNQFENQIIKLIYKKIPKSKIYNVNGLFEAKNTNKFTDTINAMKKGYHLILNGVLHHQQTKTYGVPDLIIRSDKIKNITRDDQIISHDDMMINAPKIGNQKWHYRIIDIKFMTLLLKCNGKTLQNSGLLPAYKSQLFIYNQALGAAQGYTPSEAYLLGRRWVFTKNGQKYYSNDCFDKLGIVDFDMDDVKYADLTKKALKWIQLCKTPAAKKWNVTSYPLSRSELYPNMCHTKCDNGWKELKEKIAKDNYELTSLWQVGHKNRQRAFDQGVYDWMNKKCCADLLGIGGKNGHILDQIIRINQSDDVLIKPKVIKTDLYDWKIPNPYDIFVDFEFKNAVFDDYIQLPIADTSTLIFLIGIGYYHKNKWVFKSFSVNHLTESEEERICLAFLAFIKLYKCAKLWHWSQAEVNIWNNVLLKYKSVRQMMSSTSFIWCDMLKIFQCEPIVIHGCLNFKLKNIAAAMYQHGFIDASYDETDINNGACAMIEVVHAEKKATQLNQQIDMKNVIQYNEVDVLVLYQILTYLRQHHTNKKRTNPSMMNKIVKKIKI
ncbi:MAG TPA: ribonuclease H-like domain-containing protein [Candidatus Saccharimonadales bacterium]|nr:ribonuclease H-like domain-containing protein [Candidatus Saccharimonadales bacterium]